MSWFDSRHAEALFAAVAASSDEAIVGTDATGAIVGWSRGAERTYGHPSNEVVGRSIEMLFPPDQTEEAAHLLQRIAAGDEIEQQEAMHVTRHGRRIHASVSLTPIRDNGNHVVGSVYLTRDTTAARRAERAVRRGEARWRAIIESAVDGIITIDRRGRIQSFNPAAEALFGYRGAEVIGRNVSMLMPQPYAAEHDHYVKRYIDSREPRIIGIGREVTGRRKDGSTFPMHLSVGEASIDGEITFTGIVRDLSERAALESRLREESGLARIGELAAVLAHEVKNPLAAVSGAIQMIAERLAPGSEEREISREVLQRLDALSSLMGDLLLYARPPHPNVRVVELIGLLEGLIGFFKADPEWQKVDVTIEGHASSVNADPELLKIALQNLLLNAVQAMRGVGTLYIRLGKTDAVTHIDVIDSGPGIPDAVRERVFTPFVTTKARGTGLGLATVKRIAESHGGEVRIVSSSLAGTTMRLSLP